MTTITIDDLAKTYDLVETKRKVLEDIRPEDQVIQLPEDPARRAKLEAKLEEYRQRSKDPAMQLYWLDTAYKLEMLEELFQRGRIEIGDYLDTHPNIFSVAAARFSDLCGYLGADHEYDRLCNALVVIGDYCRTGGEHTSQPVSPLRIE